MCIERMTNKHSVLKSDISINTYDNSKIVITLVKIIFKKIPTSNHGHRQLFPIRTIFLRV